MGYPKDGEGSWGGREAESQRPAWRKGPLVHGPEDMNNSHSARGRDLTTQSGGRDWPSSWTWVECLARATVVQTADVEDMLVGWSPGHRFGAVEAQRKLQPP